MMLVRAMEFGFKILRSIFVIPIGVVSFLYVVRGLNNRVGDRPIKKVRIGY